MNQRIKKFLDELEEGKKHDFRHIRRWLGTASVEWRDWMTIQETMMRKLNMTEEELRKKLAIPRYTDVSVYRDDFAPLLKKYKITGWLSDYVEFTRLSEPPTAFHFFVAMTILAASLKRRVWYDMGYFRIYPAMQIFLMGPSGVRKSTAADIVVELARDVTESSEYPPLFNELPDEGSGEGLKSHLAEITQAEGEATGLLYVSEMTTFLGKQEYNKSLITTLTDLFDGKARKFRRTEKHGKRPLKEIGVSCIMCSNEDLAFDSLSELAFKGGLFGRALIIYQKGSDRRMALPKKMMDELMNPKARVDLQEVLLKTRFIMGDIPTSGEAEGLFEGIYDEILDSPPMDENSAALHKRKGNHVLKFAMLLAIQEDLDNRKPIIQAKHIIQGKALLDWIEAQLPELYAFASRTVFGAELTRIYNMMKAADGVMDESDIKGKMATRIPGYVVDRHLATMRDSGIIRETTLDPWKGRRGWELVGILGG